LAVSEGTGNTIEVMDGTHTVGAKNMTGKYVLMDFFVLIADCFLVLLSGLLWSLKAVYQALRLY
jgi:hypothetical protein